MSNEDFPYGYGAPPYDQQVREAKKAISDYTRRLEAAVAAERPHLDDKERHELALLRDTYSLQPDGSVIFIDRRTAPTTWVHCRRDANGRWLYNASDYHATFIYDTVEDGVYYLEGAVVDVPHPAPNWAEVGDEDRLSCKDLERLVKLEGGIARGTPSVPRRLN
jgi:hypothetical protein